MMLRPRDDDDQKVIATELEITPEPSNWPGRRIFFGNHVAIAQFADRAAELRVVSNIRLDHATAGFQAADIEDFARSYPFAYAAEDWPDLARFIPPLYAASRSSIAGRQILPQGWSADTHELLVDMTQTIGRTFKHVARHEKGTQDPVRTLALGSGSCRDLAVLMIAALRSRRNRRAVRVRISESRR